MAGADTRHQRRFRRLARRSRACGARRGPEGRILDGRESVSAQLPALGPIFPELLLIAGALAVLQPGERVEIFGGSFVVDDFSRFMKVLALLGSAAALLLSIDYFRVQNIHRF